MAYSSVIRDKIGEHSQWARFFWAPFTSLAGSLGLEFRLVFWSFVRLFEFVFTFGRQDAESFS